MSPMGPALPCPQDAHPHVPRGPVPRCPSVCPTALSPSCPHAPHVPVPKTSIHVSHVLLSPRCPCVPQLCPHSVHVCPCPQDIHVSMQSCPQVVPCAPHVPIPHGPVPTMSLYGSHAVLSPRCPCVPVRRTSIHVPHVPVPTMPTCPLSSLSPRCPCAPHVPKLSIPARCPTCHPCPHDAQPRAPPSPPPHPPAASKPLQTHRKPQNPAPLRKPL